MKKLILAFATILSATLAGAAYAAPQVAQELDQLDDIWVRGKHTANMVIDTENKFFSLYNKLNKNDAYDVSCGDMSLSRGSMIMRRICVPEFIGRSNGGGSASLACATAGISGGYSEGMAYSVFVSGSCATPVFSQVSGVRRQEYADNVMQVIYSDPQLLTMARKLAGMYGEMETVQKQYVHVKDVSKVKKVRVTRGKSTILVTPLP